VQVIRIYLYDSVFVAAVVRWQSNKEFFAKIQLSIECSEQCKIIEVIHSRKHSQIRSRCFLALFTLIFALKPNFEHLVCWCLLLLPSCLREIVEMLPLDPNREIFLKRKETALFHRVER